MNIKIQYVCSIFFIIILTFSTLLINVESVSAGNRNKADSKPMIIKLSTMAPNGSPWHEIIKDMASDWHKVSEGKISLRIYPGGVAGDESDMVRKIRIGQLHAAAISNNGLSVIAKEINVLSIPMAVDSWEGLDIVRQAMSSRLETLFEQKGFVILNWGDAGWVRFFVPESIPSVEVVQKAKLFVWSGDDRAVEIWQSAGFKVVPLAATDILPGLQTGMINAFNTTPILALASQWFPFTEYMIDMSWAPLIGATVISLKTWNKIPEALRPQLKKIAEATGSRVRTEIRRMEKEAMAVMQKRGLKIITPTQEQFNEWRLATEATYPKIRGSLIPEQWFDEALKISNEMSRKNGL